MPEERNIPTPARADAVTQTVMVNGEQLLDTIQVMSIYVHKEINRIAAATLVIRDGSASEEDFPLSNEETFIPGAELEVHAGYHSQESLIFKGVIIKHGIKATRGNGSKLVVECRDAAFKMTLGRKNRGFHNLAESDIFLQVINEYGLQPEVADTTGSHESIVQYYSTDWDFLVSRAENNKMVVITDDGKVILTTPDLSPDPLLNLTYGANLLEFEAEIDARTQMPGVKASSWSSANQEMTEVDAVDPGITEQGNLSSTSIVESIGFETNDIIHGGGVATSELQSWADSALLKSRMAKIRGRCSFQGFAEVKPGSVVQFSGVGERFNGKAYVASVIHEIGRGNWVTHIQFGLDPSWFSSKSEVTASQASGLLPAVNGLQTAIVTGLAGDPAGEYRVKISIPSLDANDQEHWARIATLDAGNNRGTFFRPEIGDEVLVGFMNDDPRHPVILGIMHSSANPSPIEPSDSNDEKGYISRSLLKWLFDDNKKSIVIETPGGKKITVSDDDLIVKIEDEIGNKITMDSSGISIESAVDLILKANSGTLKLGAMNLSIDASASMKLSASASAEIKSSGTMAVKGAIVQIN